MGWANWNVTFFFFLNNAMSHPTWGERIETISSIVSWFSMSSHPTWGERIETRPWSFSSAPIRLTPHGVSELKRVSRHNYNKRGMSHPTWGERIETWCLPYQVLLAVSPHMGWANWNQRVGTIPSCCKSHPTWGEWIETFVVPPLLVVCVSHPTWGEWIETQLWVDGNSSFLSHPTWGEQIETIDIWPPAERTKSHPTRGVSELKQICQHGLYSWGCLTPHGVSELKRIAINSGQFYEVSPHMGWANWNNFQKKEK